MFYLLADFRCRLKLQQFQVNLTLFAATQLEGERNWFVPVEEECGPRSWTGPITQATTARRILLIPSLSLYTQPSLSPPHSRTHTHTPRRAAADTGSIIPSLASGLPSSIFPINKIQNQQLKTKNLSISLICFSQNIFNIVDFLVYTFLTDGTSGQPLCFFVQPLVPRLAARAINGAKSGPFSYSSRVNKLHIENIIKNYIFFFNKEFIKESDKNLINCIKF